MDKCDRNTYPYDHEKISAHADGVSVKGHNIQEVQDVARTWLARIGENSMKINTTRGTTEFTQIS